MNFRAIALALVGFGGLAAGLGVIQLSGSAKAEIAMPAAAPEFRIVAMRRLTEAQYRNSIADIFGADIRVAGRFEPIVRPVHELIAHGARATQRSRPPASSNSTPWPG